MAGDLALSNGAGNYVPGGGEPSRGKADWYAPGIVLADLTGDGRLDLYLPRYDNERPHMRSNRLYRNDGGLRFTDITETASVGSSFNSACAVAADFDNDGDQDLFVGNDLAPSHLYVNDGRGVFRDEAGARGVAGPFRAFTANFVDYDHDGRLDLYVGQWDAAGPNGHFGGQGSHVAPNLLFRQAPDGRFEDRSAEAGIECFGRSTLATAFADVSGDGFDDLYVVNDFFDDCFYLNDGDGHFTDATAAWGAGPDAMTGMGIAVGDAEGDGDLDLYLADDRLPDRAVGNVFYRNEGDRFTEMARALGLDARFSWGTRFDDFDNDGDLDLFAVTILRQGPFFFFRNEGGLRFEPTTALDVDLDGRGAATGDLDGDGLLDLVVAVREAPVALFANRTERPGHYLRVKPVGTRSNRDGIGAWIEVWSGGRRQVRTVVAGDSYRSESELVAHFGLGQALLAESVEVRFSGGGRAIQRDVAADQTLVIFEP